MRVILILLFVSVSFIGFGQKEAYSLSDTTEIFNLFQHAYYFEDETGDLTFEEICSSKIDHQFKKSELEYLNAGITKSVYWIRLDLTTEIEENWYLEYLTGGTQSLDFYQIKNEKISTQHGGIGMDQSQRSLIGKRIVFKIDLHKNDTIRCYFRVTDYTNLLLIVRGGTLLNFTKAEQTENLFHGIYFGIILLMIIYNFFLFATNRDRVYLYYVLYIAFSGLFISFFSGYANLFPDFIRMVFYDAPVLVPSLFGIFGLLFTIKFLNTKERVPKLHKFIIWIMITVNSANLCTLFGWHHASMIIIQIYGILLSIACILSGIVVLRQGYRPAKYYVIGFGAYMTGLTIMIVAAVIGFYGTLTFYAMEFGSAIEAIFLSFAIGDKLNQANKEKTKAQKESLERLLENEKLIREQNTVLEQKVKERTAEVVMQKEIIEEKQKEIVDSINYAKRIQYTLLAHDELLKQNLGEHFVLFKPKDIVSGDFYWATKKGNDFYLAVCDSTGHGVPGAFMSLLNISFLNEAINEKNISEPHEVLNHVRKRLMENMEGGQDGMDAILVRFEARIRNSDSIKIKYAAANNHPLMISEKQIKELPYDKMPVGKGEKTESFNLYEIECLKGEMLFLLTDGFADQFGGPKGKKFKSSNLSKLLLENSALEMQNQSKKLNSEFNAWKGELEQVDDVCIIGIRIK